MIMFLAGIWVGATVTMGILALLAAAKTEQQEEVACPDYIPDWMQDETAGI